MRRSSAQPVLREVFAAAPDQNTLVEAFIRARLFVSDRTGAEQKALVRLAHEALLRCWPRLVQWLTANREFLRIRARVSEEAARWRSEGRLPELLLAPGKPLAEGEFLLKQQGQELDPSIVRVHPIVATKRGSGATLAASGSDGVCALAGRGNGCVFLFRLAVKQRPVGGRRECACRKGCAEGGRRQRRGRKARATEG